MSAPEQSRREAHQRLFQMRQLLHDAFTRHLPIDLDWAMEEFYQRRRAVDGLSTVNKEVGK